VEVKNERSYTSPTCIRLHVVDKGILPSPFFSIEPVASMLRVEEIGAGWREDLYRTWYLVAISRAVEPVRKTGFH